MLEHAQNVNNAHECECLLFQRDFRCFPLNEIRHCQRRRAGATPCAMRGSSVASPKCIMCLCKAGRLPFPAHSFPTHARPPSKSDCETFQDNYGTNAKKRKLCFKRSKMSPEWQRHCSALVAPLFFPFIAAPRP